MFLTPIIVVANLVGVMFSISREGCVLPFDCSIQVPLPCSMPLLPQILHHLPVTGKLLGLKVSCLPLIMLSIAMPVVIALIFVKFFGGIILEKLDQAKMVASPI
jgi:hypothetical protein